MTLEELAKRMQHRKDQMARLMQEAEEFSEHQIPVPHTVQRQRAEDQIKRKRSPENRAVVLPPAAHGPRVQSHLLTYSGQGEHQGQQHHDSNRVSEDGPGRLRPGQEVEDRVESDERAEDRCGSEPTEHRPTQGRGRVIMGEASPIPFGVKRMPAA